MGPGAKPGSTTYVARVPMFAAATAFGTGIVVARYLYHPIWFWLVAGAFLVAIAAASRRRIPHASYAALLVGFACTGAFVSQSRDCRPVPAATVMAFANDQPVVVTGYLMRDGVVRDGQPPSESIDLAVEEVATETGAAPVSGGARVTLYAPRQRGEADDDDSGSEPSGVAGKLRQHLYGDRLRVTARLHRPVNYKNPGGFDYAAYLGSKNIHVLGSAKAELVEALPGRGGTSLGHWRATVRRSVLREIERLWPPASAALISAMIVGDANGISRDTRLEFQRSGTYHVLVVSGMNVAILAVVVFWVLRRLRAGKEWATLITVLLACGYATITDLGAPILRSVLMLSIYQATRLLYRDGAALNAIGTAALALLVWEPRALFDPSFQLTFLSVAAIAGIGIPLLERTSQPYLGALRRLSLAGYDQAFEPRIAQWRLDLRLIASRLQPLVGRRLAFFAATWIPRSALSAFELVIISVLMQVSLALAMVWYFHRLPAASFVANLAVVPLTGILMPACVAAIAMSYITSQFAVPAAAVAGWALAGITGTVHQLGPRTADVRFATPALAVCVVFAAALATAMLLVRRSRWLCATGLILLGCAALWLARSEPPVQRRPGVLELTAIDVGQAESLLIVTPEGKTLLLDAGGMLGFSRSEFDVGEDVVSPYLWSRGIRRLDAVALSHPHSDHMGGMAAVIANFRPREIWFGPHLPSEAFDRILSLCRQYAVELKPRAARQEFAWGGARFQVLSPEADVEIKPRQADNASMVLRVSYGQNSALLPGDIASKVEDGFSSRQAEADLLKVAHHGSKNSTSPEFLATVRPRWVVISAGTRNPFRHPRPEVLARLAEAHVRVYRTDLFGPVTFYLDGRTVTPSVPR